MFVAYVDSHHFRDEDTERYCVGVNIRVDNIGRPDAAALADYMEQAAQRFTERAMNRGGTKPTES